MMEMLGIEIPNEIVTKAVKEAASWRVEPIGNIGNVNPRWIGRRLNQIGPELVSLLYSADEDELNRREAQFRREAGEDISFLQRPKTWETDRRRAVSSLLGNLRALYLVLCLKQQNQYYEFHRPRK